jgi:predicted metal-dependent hydrolase
MEQAPLPFDVAPERGAAAPAHLASRTEHLARRTQHAHFAPRTSHPAPVFTRHPRARRYVVRVRGDGAVCVTIPRWGSKREAAAFADSQRAWIEKQRARIDSARETSSMTMPLHEEHVWRARAAVELPERLNALAAQHGLVVSRVSVRNQRWRWGSCSPRGHICLNWRLMLMPASVRDYVLVHELMHLKRLDHSARFWKLVAAACPGYQQARAWLRAHAELLPRPTQAPV